MHTQSIEVSSSSKPVSPGSPPMHNDFPGGELENALKEHAFGLSRYEILHKSPHEARARIALLEGKAVNVMLTTSGYSIVCDVESPARTFESLDDLLLSVSPRFEEARQQALLAKLQLLAEQQDQPGGS
ncbi:uncharacterized protein C8Q71DRAFT_349098 [Rhodofomes roseus]|uniref:GSKIP domain-containing protein n=1 Tax=Rhodofomes roseus TaxID=34475 RepID=A0ABQ8KSK9_9APHY|nr:uncharacterized protein C8Q71DRAFT_349098 [Rhodofomes roseus]KAH9841806.1 hypothetical protein C8Q71DRAFT_349098 [Rhodofomes roseus]